jgi:hypothetical protein
MPKNAGQVYLYLTKTENRDRGQFGVLPFPQYVKSSQNTPKNNPNYARKVGEKHE